MNRIPIGAGRIRLSVFSLVLGLSVTVGSGADQAVHTLHVDAGVRRVIRLGKFQISKLDRDIYFRCYHMPGLFSAERDRELQDIGATPGRGTAPYFSFDKQHSYSDPTGGGHGKPAKGEPRPQRTDFREMDFQKLVDQETEKWIRIYREAGRRFPGLRHALAGLGAFPEAMRRDGATEILDGKHYKDFAALLVDFFDRLKAAGCSLPAWYAAVNEPSAAWGGKEFAAYSALLARAMAEKHPDIKIAGPCSAWPYPQSDWRRWNSFERPFIEGAGHDVGAYDLHLYSKGYWAYTDERLMGDPLNKKQASPSLHTAQRTGVATVWDYGRADGLLDLFAAHHKGFWNEDPKPMIISEFGHQGIEPQLGPWQNDFKPWLYMTTVTRLWMTFMERPEVGLAVPFITGESCLDYGAKRGQAVYNRPGAPDDRSLQPTRFREFYKFFRDLDGTRVRARLSGRATSDARDISARVFSEGKVLHVLLHNGNGYPNGNQSVKLAVETGLDAQGNKIAIQQAGIKRLRWEGPVPTDHTASVLEGSLRIDPKYLECNPNEPIELSGEETAIVRLELSAEPIQRAVTEYVDYSGDTVIDPNAEGVCKMTLNIPQREGKLVDATLWLSLARDGGFANNPVVLLNGEPLPAADVTFSKGIKDFHRPIEIPLDATKLRESNEIQVIIGPAERLQGSPKVVAAKIVTSRETKTE